MTTDKIHLLNSDIYLEKINDQYARLIIKNNGIDGSYVLLEFIVDSNFININRKIGNFPVDKLPIKFEKIINDIYEDQVIIIN